MTLTDAAPTLLGMPLSPAVMLDVKLHAICSRNEYTSDPAPVIEELRAAAGDRIDILAKAVGVWAGVSRDENTAPLCDAIEAEIPECEPWLNVGRERRSRPTQRTTRDQEG